MGFRIVRDYPDFRRLWFAQLLAFIGEGIFQVALVWWLITQVGSEKGAGTLVGSIMSLSFLPMVLIGPFAGALADRLCPKVLLVGADLFRALLVAIGATLMFAGSLQIWHLFVLSVLLAAAGVFHSPVTLSVIPRVVAAERLEDAMAIHTIVRDLAKLVGPATGGFILGFASPGVAFAIHAAMLISSAILVLAMRIGAAGQPEARESVLSQLREGFRYVRGQSTLFDMLLGFSLLNLFVVPIVVLLPLTVASVLHRGSFELGLSEGTLALGSVLTGSFFARLFAAVPVSKLLIRALAFSGFLFAGFALNQWFPLFLGGLFLLGGCFTSVNVAVLTLFQRSVAPEFKGRFFSLVETLSSAFFPLALGAAGWFSDRWGVPMTYAVCAAGILILTVRFARIPNLSAIDQDPEVATQSQSQSKFQDESQPPAQPPSPA